jgi:hypothetical protein
MRVLLFVDCRCKGQKGNSTRVKGEGISMLFVFCITFSYIYIASEIDVMQAAVPLRCVKGILSVMLERQT